MPLQAAEKQTASIEERKRVLFVLSMQGGKIMAAGSDTAANGIIKLAGGVNAIEGFSGYKQLSDEAVVTARPDAILMMSNAGPPVSDDELFGNVSIASTPAGTARKLIRIDGGYLLGFDHARPTPSTTSPPRSMARRLRTERHGRPVDRQAGGEEDGQRR